MWVRIPAWPVAALVSLSKTLNHNCFVLRMGRKAVGPVCCVMHVKEPRTLIVKEKGLAPVFLDSRLEHPAGWICARYKSYHYHSRKMFEMKHKLFKKKNVFPLLRQMSFQQTSSRVVTWSSPAPWRYTSRPWRICSPRRPSLTTPSTCETLPASSWGYCSSRSRPWRTSGCSPGSGSTRCSGSSTIGLWRIRTDSGYLSEFNLILRSPIYFFCKQVVGSVRYLSATRGQFYRAAKQRKLLTRNICLADFLGYQPNLHVKLMYFGW